MMCAERASSVNVRKQIMEVAASSAAMSSIIMTVRPETRSPVHGVQHCVQRTMAKLRNEAALTVAIWPKQSGLRSTT